MFLLLENIQPSGTARIAKGVDDAGKVGYAKVIIGANDEWNGKLGFAPSSQSATIDEDSASPKVALTLSRQVSFEATSVEWRATFTRNKNYDADGPLREQLEAVQGRVLCLAGEQTCQLEIAAKRETIPEFEIKFFIELVAAGQGASIDVARKYSAITILASDHPNGLIGYEQSSIMKKAEDNDKKALLTIVRDQGDAGRVSVDYHTMEANASQVSVGGVAAFQALVDFDFSYSQGTVVFEEGETRKQIEIPLTPDSASSNPLPKVFHVDLR